jgi:hypothetical protein
MPNWRNRAWQVEFKRLRDEILELKEQIRLKDVEIEKLQEQCQATKLHLLRFSEANETPVALEPNAQIQPRKQRRCRRNQRQRELIWKLATELHAIE